jgi:uncharacterized protein
MSEPDSRKWHTREDSGILLDEQLRWWHDGILIEHPNIIEAFHRGLHIDDAGRAILKFGNDWCVVSVVDCTYRINAIDIHSQGVTAWLSDRSTETLDLMTLTIKDNVLRAQVKKGKAWALFSRNAQFELVSHCEVTEAPTLQLRSSFEGTQNTSLVKTLAI